MGRIWIVNPFDPLPGDPEQPGRYATLARMLCGEGHEVVLWTADFSHRFKRPVDRAPIEETARRERIEVRFVHVPGYKKNVSCRRILSHRVYARGFEQEASDAARPDVIIASNPPLESPVAAGRLAKRFGARLIIDVQDNWIDNFRHLMPRALKWASPVILRPWVWANQRAFAAADAVVGVAGGYADEPRRYGRPEYRRAVIPLGVDLELFDEAARRGRGLLGEKQPGEIWAVYSGSYSHAYDVLTVAEVARRVLRERPDVRFIFSGRGDLESQVRDLLRGTDRVSFLGFAPFEDWAATVCQCDVGFNAIRPEAFVLMPNKVFYYWAAGLAVLNSAEGECADWVAQTETGLSYAAGDVAGAKNAMMQIVSDPKSLSRQREASRRSAVERWDRRLLYRPYLKLVSDLCARSRGRDSS
ncbi:MAG TPA: glycosyltransferase family 4 protein [Phycisphaerae bacterium]|nr:glycosyltransferase family 4 protein [Phycisphaerae bacterium]